MNIYIIEMHRAMGISIKLPCLFFESKRKAELVLDIYQVDLKCSHSSLLTSWGQSHS